MYTLADMTAVGALDLGPEIFVADTDAQLGDACNVLATGQRSELLRAIDAGSAIGLMSEQAFRELGWMSASAARGHGLDHNTLRALITDDYLPRIPVVATPTPGSGHWMPTASDIADPDDVAHVQVARLIAARAIYSHDKHLRRPRLAPATRPDYDQRIMNLSVVSGRRESEHAAAIAIGVAGAGSTAAVSWTSVHLRLKPAMVWAALALTSAAGAYFALAPPERRRRIAARLEPAMQRMGAAVQRSDSARRELSAAHLVTATDTHRIEAQVATYLARNPDANMATVAEALGFTRFADHAHHVLPG